MRDRSDDTSELHLAHTSERIQTSKHLVRYQLLQHNSHFFRLLELSSVHRIHDISSACAKHIVTSIRITILPVISDLFELDA